MRERSGVGRASKNDWKNVKEVGPKFFEDMEKHRLYSVDFSEIYDIVIWDLEAGQYFPHLYNKIQKVFSSPFMRLRDYAC